MTWSRIVTFAFLGAGFALMLGDPPPVWFVGFVLAMAGVTRLYGRPPR